MTSTPRFRYSKWDGAQVGFDLDAEAVLEEITDDLLYHGDLHAALRRLMQQGFEDRNGERVMGMRDLMARLRQQRRARLERSEEHTHELQSKMSNTYAAFCLKKTKTTTLMNNNDR